MNYQELIEGVLKDFLDSITGIIVSWSGAIADIPDGWILCDGNNGTPNLMDRQIIAAGHIYAVDATGGITAHSHELFSFGHTHDFESGTDITGFNVDRDVTTALNGVDGETESKSNLSPYHALAYIKKVA